MDHLSSCYFCGSAIEDPLGVYEISDGTDEQATITLCPACHRKVETVFDAAGVDRLTPSENGRALAPRTGTETMAGTDTVSPEDGTPVMTDEPGDGNLSNEESETGPADAASELEDLDEALPESDVVGEGDGSTELVGDADGDVFDDETDAQTTTEETLEEKMEPDIPSEFAPLEGTGDDEESETDSSEDGLSETDSGENDLAEMDSDGDEESGMDAAEVEESEIGRPEAAESADPADSHGAKETVLEDDDSESKPVESGNTAEDTSLAAEPESSEPDRADPVDAESVLTDSTDIDSTDAGSTDIDSTDAGSADFESETDDANRGEASTDEDIDPDVLEADEIVTGDKEIEDAFGSESAADDSDTISSTAEGTATDDSGDAGAPRTGDDGTARTTISALEYNKVMRLLQNREFPVERAEIVSVAASAYDLAEADCAEVIDLAVDRGLLDERDGELVRPE